MTERRPILQLLREGNPGHRPAARFDGGVRLKPALPREPNWADVFPTAGDDPEQRAAVRRLRATARDEWGLVVRELDPQGLLATVDASVLKDHATAEAIRCECVRQLAIEGLVIDGRTGRHRNPHSAMLAQQRERLKFTSVQLGLTPLARDSLNPRSSQDDDHWPFD